jgi:hypothetical protein
MMPTNVSTTEIDLFSDTCPGSLEEVMGRSREVIRTSCRRFFRGRFGQN